MNCETQSCLVEDLGVQVGAHYLETWLILFIHYSNILLTHSHYLPSIICPKLFQYGITYP